MFFKEEDWGWIDGSVGTRLAVESSGPEFGSLAHTSKSGSEHMESLIPGLERRQNWEAEPGS